MGYHDNQVEALRDQAEGAVSEIRSVLDVTRAELDEASDDTEGISLAKQDYERVLAEAMTKAGDLCLQKFSAEVSLQHLSNQVVHAQEEMSRLLSKLGVMRAEREKAVNSAVAAMEEVFRFSTELVALRYEAEAFYAHDANTNISGETSHAELEAMRGEVSMLNEWVVILGSGEAKVLAESKAAWAEVVQFWTKLETSWVDLEHLQTASSQGGDTLSLGSISVNAHASVIMEYLRSNV
ncbi:hypothetical protein ACLOJK_036555 [Asimina triloba]